MKDKERLRNYHTLEETVEPCQLNAMWEPGTEKKISGKIAKIQKKNKTSVI